MNIQVGDTVRYLNAVGGGKVVRIDGNIAYVDEDGFETPVLARECVVINTPSAPAHPKSPAQPKPAPATITAKTAALTELPVVEVPDGDSINLCLAFEPQDIRTLSVTGFDAYIVNDSNYRLYLSVATRDTADSEWTPRYDGMIEPNIQEFAFELPQSELPHLGRILVQAVAFKRDKLFAAKGTVDVEMKVDATKFARLHCFRPNRYFDTPVIAFDIVANDLPAVEAPLEDLRKASQKAAVSPKSRAKGPAVSKSSKPGVEPLIVDLHASELLDSVAGLSTADILNYQVDTFRRIMDENLRHPGRKIVFIHGKGEGVLRNALMKELNHRYKGHDVQDASFAEYGYGATSVTISGGNSRRK